jgi:LL-diaminopimelate aminotransferase
LGIGDVTLPLVPAITDALHDAVDEMGVKESFKGYRSDAGYEFLRDAIAGEFALRGVHIDSDEIFVNDGAKSDSGNIGDIFDTDNVVAVCDPVYPVYVDTNAMAGRAGVYDQALGKWTKLVYIPCTKETGFLPELPQTVPDIIYICSPNNPTGAVVTKDRLQQFVDYANEHGSVILFDAAYESYISHSDIPHTIYECEGAKTCAIELRSFSKNAGFTGLRLGYTVIPAALERGGVKLASLWERRQGTKFNGAPYIVQKAGAAVFTPEGKKQTAEQVAYYMENARLIREGLQSAGYSVSGGEDAPYIWLETPKGQTSWEFFDHLLETAHVVGTPGAGFGPSGEGYFRLTAFGDRENTVEAIKRISAK